MNCNDMIILNCLPWERNNQRKLEYEETELSINEKFTFNATHYSSAIALISTNGVVKLLKLIHIQLLILSDIK